MVMKTWYIYFNIAMVLLLLWLIKVHVWPNEYADATMLNRQFSEIKKNQECIQYLQNIAVTPTWRFSLISSLLFTMIEAILYVLAGGTFTEPMHFFTFWILLILNWLFMYKSLATRNWHYNCDHGCSAQFKK